MGTEQAPAVALLINVADKQMERKRDVFVACFRDAGLPVTDELTMADAVIIEGTNPDERVCRLSRLAAVELGKTSLLLYNRRDVTPAGECLAAALRTEAAQKRPAVRIMPHRLPVADCDHELAYIDGFLKAWTGYGLWSGVPHM